MGRCFSSLSVVSRSFILCPLLPASLPEASRIFFVAFPGSFFSFPRAPLLLASVRALHVCSLHSQAKAALASRGGAEGVPGGADPLSCGVLSSGTERREGGVQTGGMDSFLGPGLVPLDMSLLSTCMQQFLLLIGLHRKLDQVHNTPSPRSLSLSVSLLPLSLSIYVHTHLCISLCVRNSMCVLDRCTRLGCRRYRGSC